MKLLQFITLGSLLLSQTVFSNSIYSIRIFQSESMPVSNDLTLPAHVDINVHYVDQKRQVKATLNDLVKKRVIQNNDELNDRAAYIKAFNQVRESDQWEDIFQQMGNTNRTLDSVVRYRIEKIPAIVINDKSIIYGMTSLREAIEIYEQKGGY